MVAKRVSNNQFRDAKLNKRSTTVLAGPRLDCARDASLEHQQNHGAARKQGKSTLWIFFRFFLRCFYFLRKITIMASVSKLFLGQTDRMGTKFFRPIFFFDCPDPKTGNGSKKLPIMAPVSKHSETPKNRIARIFFRKMRFQKILGLNGGWFPDSGKETRIGI